MANPQIENGFTRIANEILEHLCLAGINGSEYRILISVIRKTYGFNKKKDYISLTQYQKLTTMNRPQAVKTIKSLVSKRILLKDNSVYKLNKNWEEWVVAKRIPSMQKDTTASMQLDTKSSMQLDTYKRKKETITKDIAISSPFIIEEKLKDMEKTKNSYLDIIATFIREKGLKIENSKQLSAVISRYCRVAKTLSGAYSNEQIFGAMDKIKKDNEKREKKGDTVDWTLETALKQLVK